MTTTLNHAIKVAADPVPVRADFATLYPEELKRKVLAGWTTLYGFPGDMRIGHGQDVYQKP